MHRIEASANPKGTEGTDVSVSVDGTWQKRGFSSLNGVVAAISITNGKVLDCEAMTRSWKSCMLHAPLQKSNPNEFGEWEQQHKNQCKLNYTGSAPNMETTGAVRIFERSIEKSGLRYVSYYGDGDSKSFNAIENVYPGIKVKKFERTGHYQKRVGNRLRKLKLRVKGRVKGLVGRGKAKRVNHAGEIVKAKDILKSRLTDAMIDRLQNYFGIALRSNAKTVPELRNALLASFFHVASSTECNYHTYCPKSSDSWCQFQRDMINETNLYKSGPGIAADVVQEVKKVYAELTKDADLSKCLHGITQNANESFNAMIWERAPKSKYCGIDKIKLCVYDAIGAFNYGSKSSLDIYTLLSIKPGFFTTKLCCELNLKRKYNSGYKNLDSSKRKRKIIRGDKKKKDDKNTQKEGKTYEPGGLN